MKAEKQKKIGDFRQLRVKILTRTLLMMLVAVVAINSLYGFILRGHFASLVVGFLDTFIYQDYDMALLTYRSIFGQYGRFIFILAIVFVFVCIFCFYLSNFTKYFNEVNRGIDELVNEGYGEIVLSPELAAVEKKLKTVRHTLEKRKLDAQAAEQRKNDLIVYLAHDLKTPLTSIIGYLTLLRDEPQLSIEMRARYTGIVLDKAERLEELINEFFDITRFNLTMMTLEPERRNLSRMLEQMVSEFIPILNEKGLRWQTDIAPNVDIVCDPDKLERVFDNLIRNAVNYSYDQTELTLTMRADGNMAEICVENHGRTIPPEKLTRIFEQFFRLDTSRSSSTGGAGLGLAIAKEIVELHGGSIQAESHDERILFTVKLPLE